MARTLLCGREWCSDCGQRDSDAHKRRWARWLPKAQQLRSVGYLVVTFPLDVRDRLRTRSAWQGTQRAVTAVLRRMGFRRGLRRWHWFGDASTTFNPHLNFLLDSGKLTRAELQTLKSEIAGAIGVACVMHYQYTTVPAKILHLLKYVTRPTFTDSAWDPAIADELYGFRNTWCWGIWRGPQVWTVEHSDGEVSAEARAVLGNACPHCAGPLTWGPTPIPSSYLTTLRATPIDSRILLLPAVPSRNEWQPANGGPAAPLTVIPASSLDV